MVDFNRINFTGVNSTSSVGGSAPASQSSGPNLLGASGPVDSFTPSNPLFGGGSGVDFNAISQMSLADAQQAIPGSFQGLQILANL